MKILLQGVTHEGRDCLGTFDNAIVTCKSPGTLQRTHKYEWAKNYLVKNKDRLSHFRIEEFSYGDNTRVYGYLIYSPKFDAAVFRTSLKNNEGLI